MEGRAPGPGAPGPEAAEAEDHAAGGAFKADFDLDSIGMEPEPEPEPEPETHEQETAEPPATAEPVGATTPQRDAEAARLQRLASLDRDDAELHVAELERQQVRSRSLPAPAFCSLFVCSVFALCAGRRVSSRGS